MVEFLAIFSMSLLGSWHCAGMCGPLGSLFSHLEEKRKMALSLYHLGRLTTYLLLAVFVQRLNLIARPVLGDGLIFSLLLLWALAVIFEWKPRSAGASVLFKFTQRLKGFHFAISSFGLGLTTTLLPCAWLYGFILLAAAKSNLAETFGLIFSFWLGTIPALVGAHLILSKVSLRARRFSRKFSAVFMLVLGILFWKTHPPSIGELPATESRSCPMHHGTGE